MGLCKFSGVPDPKQDSLGSIIMLNCLGWVYTEKHITETHDSLKSWVSACNFLVCTQNIKFTSQIKKFHRKFGSGISKNSYRPKTQINHAYL